MKLRWKVTAGLLAAGALCALFVLRSENSEQKAVEETRRALRRQGFKTDLSEFDFSTSAEIHVRAATLTNATSLTPRTADDFNRRSALLQGTPDLMAAVGSNAALVVWNQDNLPGRSGEDLWPALREALAEDRTELDAACQAALSGPIRINLDASRGIHMLLPHLASLKRLAQTLETRAMLELHDGNKDAAWTNLLALTRLATSYDPESVEVAHLVRYNCATIAFNATWQALRAVGWTDDRLARLQKEWESADFFRGLPETAAFSRAGTVAACKHERQQPLTGLGMTLRGTLSSPRIAWSALTDYWRRVRYRQHGTYEDEKALLLYYRDREIELRRAVLSQTWLEMRQLPGATNMIPFQSKFSSSTVTMMNLRQLSLAWSMYAEGQGQRLGLPGRAAHVEARRRIIITAIALERFRGRHGSHPEVLQELVPELLKNAPVDFMDAKPLRYRRTDDGRFVLYSVGLDCTDNGGQMQRSRPRGMPGERVPVFSISQDTDLVWPLPASAAEVEYTRREQLKVQAEIADRSEDLQAEEQWRDTARRQARIEKLLAAKPPVRSAEPTLRGRPLSEVLRNKIAHAANPITLDELLTLKPVITGEEPEKATFETPINHDALTNLGSPNLYIDLRADEDFDGDCDVGQFEWRRATNGNCLIVLSTLYESPGKHALQMGLELEQPDQDEESIIGPLAPFVVSNLCQFSLSSAFFNPELGATLRAKLPEPNGTYTIEIASPAGDHLKTITGSTSNGVMKVHWDLTDDRGRKCTNNAYGTLIRVTLSDSGRSQTLKGP